MSEHIQDQPLESGMTLRDHFAVRALQGMLSTESRRGTIEGFVRDAYLAADWMMIVRQQKPRDQK